MMSLLLRFLIVAVLCIIITSAEEDIGSLFAVPHLIVADGPNPTPNPFRKRANTYAVNWPPSMLKSLYNMDQSDTAGSGKTIAIVDAYAHPNTESDLAVFCSRYNLPACTTANGCFKRVDKSGGTNYPTQSDAGWAQEASLDVQWAHAMAPGAKILYIEADSSMFSDLFKAVQYAANNADYVSMSFGVVETSSIPSTYENTFSTAATLRGVSFFASAGDTGAQINYPASSSKVIAVGGTTLYASMDGTLQAETGWSNSGGGCSSSFSASTDQKTATNSVCGTLRAIPDVSWNSDPNSGVSVYVSEGCSGAATGNCWYTIGGTSLAAPVIAAHAAASGVKVTSASVYSGGSMLFRDVVQGSNGHSCATGYDLVTGLGSWVNAAAASSTTTTAAAAVSTGNRATTAKAATTVTTAAATTASGAATTSRATTAAAVTAATTSRTTTTAAATAAAAGSDLSTTTGKKKILFFGDAAGRPQPTYKYVLFTTLITLLLSILFL